MDRGRLARIGPADATLTDGTLLAGHGLALPLRAAVAAWRARHG
jgi:hypothetical protein